MAKITGPIIVSMGPIRPYYTILVKWEPTSRWRIEFGSYDTDDIDGELEELVPQVYVADVVMTDGTQEAIDHVLAHKNSFMDN